MSKTVNVAFRKFLAQYPQHAEETEERAAIIEYDAGKKRDVAESMAMLRIKDKYKLWGKI